MLRFLSASVSTWSYPADMVATTLREGPAAGVFMRDGFSIEERERLGRAKLSAKEGWLTGIEQLVVNLSKMGMSVRRNLAP